MKAVVVAHGDALPADRQVAAAADLLIAADGGALICLEWGLTPGLVVGDLDSLGAFRAAELGRSGTRVLGYPASKDETDTELAVAAALREGAGEVVLVAALGGERADHELANILMLTDARLDGRVRAVRGDTSIRALRGGGRLALAGLPGDTVSLIPVGDAGAVTTEGLRYPLRGETLRGGAARGVSNIVETVPASVAIAHGVLIVLEISRGGVS